MRHLLVIFGVIFSLMQLQGCVGLFAAGVAGTAVIVTDPRTADQQMADQRIEMEVDKILGRAPFDTEKVHFNVVSYYGKVLLVGQTLDTNLPTQLVVEIKKIEGVKKVYNQIRQIEPVGLGQISSDTFLTTKVKTALLTVKDIKSNSIKVLTENNEVFLLGVVTRAQAKLARDAARNVSGVTQVIDAFDFSD